MASFYVTAIYENPAGESEASNVVVIGDLPMGAEEAEGEHKIWIGFDLSNQVLMIRGAAYARSLRVFDMQGRLVGLGAGVYGVVVWDRYGGIRSKMIEAGL